MPARAIFEPVTFRFRVEHSSTRTICHTQLERKLLYFILAYFVRHNLKGISACSVKIIVSDELLFILPDSLIRV